MKRAYRRVVDDIIAVWRDELGSAVLRGQDVHVDVATGGESVDRSDHRAAETLYVAAKRHRRLGLAQGQVR